jgi:hypothetical protein
MIPKFRAWNSETKEIEVFETYEEISELFLSLSADDGFYSIMQSTGLFDKNGKEIFEGDILKFNDEWAEYDYCGYVDGVTEGINCVEVVRGEACFEFGKTKLPESALFAIEDEHFKFKDFIKDEGREFEIIGNIYENPELLEKER